MRHRKPAWRLVRSGTISGRFRCRTWRSPCLSCKPQGSPGTSSGLRAGDGQERCGVPGRGSRRRAGGALLHQERCLKPRAVHRAGRLPGPPGPEPVRVRRHLADSAIRVNDATWPVLLMDWIDGRKLDQYVDFLLKGSDTYRPRRARAAVASLSARCSGPSFRARRPAALRRHG